MPPKLLIKRDKKKLNQKKKKIDSRVLIMTECTLMHDIPHG